MLEIEKIFKTMEQALIEDIKNNNVIQLEHNI
jgi:hypothetical protein